MGSSHYEYMTKISNCSIFQKIYTNLASLGSFKSLEYVKSFGCFVNILLFYDVILLYYIVLFYIILCYIILYYIILYYFILYFVL